MWKDVDERGASLLVEYLILMGILSVFVAVMSLQLHETLSEVQIARVMENNLADATSKISAIYTDYVLMMFEEGYIITKMDLLPDIGGRGYEAEFFAKEDIVYVLGSDGKIKAVSGLGLNKFYTKKGFVDVVALGKTFSKKYEEKPIVQLNKTAACSFVPEPRIAFDPCSVKSGDNVTIRIIFENADKIREPVEWKLRLWNGSTLSGIVNSGAPISRTIRVTDVEQNCQRLNGSQFDYSCKVMLEAWISDKPNCRGTHGNELFVSTKPEEANPFLVCSKWVEPRRVSPGEVFELHLALEGRGFVVEGAANLSVVHVIDVSGSMIWPTIFKKYSFTVNPNVINKTINLPQNGRLEIYAYTTHRLPQWYSNDLCRCTGTSCPWWNKGYDSSFIRLYLNGAEVGSAYSSGQAIGKSYTNNNAQAGNYTIELVASAPEKINLTLVVRFRNSEILNETFEYLNREKVSFELPSGVNYTFLAINDTQYLPNWDMEYRTTSQWSSYVRIESYTVSGQSRYWDYRWIQCGDRSYTYQPGSLNAWIILPDGSKQFLLKGENTYWFQARNNYGTNGINADLFIPNPQTGEYEFVVVPITNKPVTFTATAYIKRIDAAKLAGITFNSMLGDKDFVGLATFSTDAQRVVVNSSSAVLKYMTKDKITANNEILKLRAELATDHSDGLYFGSRVFPIWNESGNNCTSCISGLRPLIVMLTDGEPTICNRGELYYNCALCTQSCTGGSWCEAAKNQALCIAEYLKNNVRVNDFNVSICTIGFTTDIGGQGQQFLKQMASLRPDNNEPCYFFAETSDELVEAYRTIFNAFQIAAKNIVAQDALNVSITSPFRILSVTATSNKPNSSIPQPEIVETATNTVIRLNITSIQKDEVVELIVRLKVKEDAPYGEYDINDNSNSFIEYTALNNRGEEIGKRRMNITECGFVKARISVVPKEGATIILK